MKEQAYEDYCSQVCDVMQKATKAERRCLTEELTDHMESHVEALLEEGWPEDEAVRYAVEAMGDPETVGRQYDEKLSSFWRICGVMLRWILILMVVNLLTGPVRVSFIQFYDSLMARWNPHLKYEDTMREGTLARRDLDIRIPREGRQTNVYRLDLGYDAQREGYFVAVYTVTYADNPLHLIGSDLMKLEHCFQGSRGTGYGGTEYYIQYADIEKGDTSIGLTIYRLGEDIQVEIPVDWEGIL